MSDTNQKVDELISLLKAMDTKIKFILDDMDEVKQNLTQLSDTVLQMAMDSATQKDHRPSDGNKAARLEAFRQQTARW